VSFAFSSGKLDSDADQVDLSSGLPCKCKLFSVWVRLERLQMLSDLGSDQKGGDLIFGPSSRLQGVYRFSQPDLISNCSL
jgi:hypothetical protein